MTAPADHAAMRAAVDALFDCRQPTGHGPCVYPAGHTDPCQGMPPSVPLCHTCHGHGHTPGTGDMCWTCQGRGILE